MRELDKAIALAEQLRDEPTCADGWRKVRELFAIRDRVVALAGHSHDAMRFHATINAAWDKYRTAQADRLFDRALDLSDDANRTVSRITVTTAS